MKVSMFILALVCTLSAQAQEKLIFTGELFDKDNKKVANYERFQEVKGDRVLDRAVFKTLDGQVMTEEKMDTVAGKLVRYDMGQKQIKQQAWIEVKGGKVTFNLKKEGKPNYPSTIDEPENFMIGLEIVPFIQKHWDSLLKGEEKTIRLGVWHRQEAIRFDLTKVEGKAGELVIKMSPSSMFIRALVDPIFFDFDLKTKDLNSYRGRAVPKINRDGKFEDFDGKVTYKRAS